MHIISKFKDYYDSAVGMGIDKSIIYERHDKEISNKDYDFAAEINGKPKNIWHRSSFDFETDHPKKDKTGASEIVIGFCGKLYPAIRFSTLLKRKEFSMVDEYDVEFVFDKEEAIEKLDLKNRKPRYSWGSHKKPIDIFNDNWNKVATFDPIETHRKFNTPIFVWEKDHKCDLIINPRLKEFMFARVFDPYTAFQEVQMYISGVLGVGSDGSDIVMTEKQKVQQHGFDAKYGFRTRPKKKK